MKGWNTIRTLPDAWGRNDTLVRKHLRQDSLVIETNLVLCGQDGQVAGSRWPQAPQQLLKLVWWLSCYYGNATQIFVLTYLPALFFFFGVTYLWADRERLCPTSWTKPVLSPKMTQQLEPWGWRQRDRPGDGRDLASGKGHGVWNLRTATRCSGLLSI